MTWFSTFLYVPLQRWENLRHIFDRHLDNFLYCPTSVLLWSQWTMHDCMTSTYTKLISAYAHTTKLQHCLLRYALSQLSSLIQSSPSHKGKRCTRNIFFCLRQKVFRQWWSVRTYPWSMLFCLFITNFGLPPGWELLLRTFKWWCDYIPILGTSMFVCLLFSFKNYMVSSRKQIKSTRKWRTWERMVEN